MSKKASVLAAVGCGTFMATLDASIVNIALPTLTKELDADLLQVKWVVIVYLLTITCLLLPFGRISDQYGRKWVFAGGYLVFTVGSVLCGLAPTLGALLAVRAVQAVGAAMLMSNGPAVVTYNVCERERGSTLGILAMIVSAGLIAGPSVGGFLISHFGWRSIFLVNIPVGVLGLVLASLSLKSEDRPVDTRPFDGPGLILQAVFLVSFVWLFEPPSVSFAGESPFPISRWVALAITVLFGFLLIKVEALAPAPLLDLSLLRLRNFWAANLASFLNFVAFSAVSVLTPFYLEEVARVPTQRAGLYMTAIPLMVLIVAPIAGRLSDRFGSRVLTSVGASITAFALFGMSGAFGVGFSAGLSPVWILFALGSVGVATGLFQSPNNNSIMNAVPFAKLGVASAMLATFRNLGMVTGTGLATTLFSWQMSVTHDYERSLHLAHWVAGLMGIGAVVASLAKRPEKQARQEAESKKKEE